MAQKVLVTFARNRIGYTIAKSMACHGFEVTTADSVKLAMTNYSRFSKRHFTYPDFHLDEDAFIKTIIDECKRRDIKTILPGHEELYVLAHHQNKLKQNGIKAALPSSRQIALAHDKNKITAQAEKLGIKVPRTYRFESLDDFKKSSSKIKRFPVVIKLTKTRGGIGFFKAHDSGELTKEYESTINAFNIKKSEDFPIVQDFIDGWGLGVSMLYNRGKAVASFTHRRIWEYPPEGGFSIERVSAHHKKAEVAAQKLLDSLKWHGVAMVEFRVDKETGEPWFLEINPRFWGSLNQAVAAGVDFSYLAYKVANEQKIKPVFSYKTGVRTRWVAGMIVALPAYLKSKLRWKFLGSFFNVFSRNLHFDDISLTDPLPFLVEFIKPLIDIFSGKSLRQQDFEEVKRNY